MVLKQAQLKRFIIYREELLVRYEKKRLWEGVLNIEYLDPASKLNLNYGNLMLILFY